MKVTPFVGVWIETRPRGSFHFASWSHPSWVCGLKLHFRLNCVLRNSHTLRGCVDWNGWTSHYYNVNIQSHPSWVCGLKLRRDGTMTQHRSHTLRGCVDWNWQITDATTTATGHTLRGCVDWNTKKIVIYIFLMSHTLRGCVDWNGLYKNQRDQYDASHPSWVCGMKQKTDFIFWAHLKKSFLRKRAIDCQ